MYFDNYCCDGQEKADILWQYVRLVITNAQSKRTSVSDCKNPKN